MRSLFVFLILLLATSSSDAQWDRAEEQIAELRSLADSTATLQNELDQSGNLNLKKKHYRITKTLHVDLAKHGAALIDASVGSTLIMDGAGPALRIVGTHQGTASPKTFKPKTWNQRMPTIRGLEILGANPKADGIQLDGTVAAIVSGVSVRWCRHGIHLANRNRNVIISDCHLYDNSGIGIFLDDVNLHQINVKGTHVSYNRGGGIVVRDGNVRNLQIVGCDIEGNMPADQTPTKTANVLIDVSGSPGDKSKSIAEISITGCTIQHAANYGAGKTKGVALGGANIRLAGKEIYPINSVTISGNVLSDTTTNVDLMHCHDIIIANNNFFAPGDQNLRVGHSERVNVVGNTFNPRNFVRPGTIVFDQCRSCVLSNSTLHKLADENGAVQIMRCSEFVIANLIFSSCESGIVFDNSRSCSVANCRYVDFGLNKKTVVIRPPTDSIRVQKP